MLHGVQGCRGAGVQGWELPLALIRHGASVTNVKKCNNGRPPPPPHTQKKKK